MAAKDLATVVREMYEAWNAKDMERCASYSHPDAQMTNMAFNAKISLRDHIEGWARAFPDGKIEIVNCVVQGDNVITEFKGRGTHTGTMKGPTGDLAPTGRRVEVSCVESLRFRDGKVAEGRMYFDAFSFFTQLGVGAPAQGKGRTEAQQTQPPRH
jgi:predicted ester cyclase